MTDATVPDFAPSAGEIAAAAEAAWQRIAAVAEQMYGGNSLAEIGPLARSTIREALIEVKFAAQFDATQRCAALFRDVLVAQPEPA